MAAGTADRYFTCQCSSPNHGRLTGCSGTGSGVAEGLCAWCVAECSPKAAAAAEIDRLLVNAAALHAGRIALAHQEWMAAHAKAAKHYRTCSTGTVRFHDVDEPPAQGPRCFRALHVKRVQLHAHAIDVPGDSWLVPCPQAPPFPPV
jgi:hypothetical protein